MWEINNVVSLFFLSHTFLFWFEQTITAEYLSWTLKLDFNIAIQDNCEDDKEHFFQHENLCSSSWSVFQSDRVFCSNNNNPVATNKLLCLRRRWSVFISKRDFILAPISNHPIHHLWKTVGRSSSSKSPFYIMFSFWCYDFLAPFLYCYFHTSYSHREWKKGACRCCCCSIMRIDISFHFDRSCSSLLPNW